MFNEYGLPNAVETNVFLDVKKCIVASTQASESAINFFEKDLRSLVAMAARNTEDRFQMRLLLLGLVSSSENYFRQVLSDLLAVCPISQKNAYGLDVKYYSAAYFSNSMVSRALTDGIVFSGANNVVDGTKKLTNLDINTSGSVKAALTEFQKVCVLRHAVVHSYGILGGKNIYDLGINSDLNMIVALTWDAFQEICDVCLNLIRAYNSFLWRTSVARLREKGYIIFNGDESDYELFCNLRSVFWSDGGVPVNPRDTYENIKNAILAV